MNNEIPFTEKTLKEWAGWRAFRDGKALFSRGVVEKVVFEDPIVIGLLNLGPRGIRSRFKVLKNGLVDNLCPCRDNQDKGLICPHLVALGMALLAKQAGASKKEEEDARLRRAEELEERIKGRRIRRTKKTSPGAVEARLVLVLPKDWKEGVLRGKPVVDVFVDIHATRTPAEDIDMDCAYAFPYRDERILNYLEQLSGGVVKNRQIFSIADFIKFLSLHIGKPLFYKGKKSRGYTVAGNRCSTILEMDLDRKTGEILLNIGAETFEGVSLKNPFHIIGKEKGWVFCNDHFWPLTDLFPPLLREIYREPIRIPRSSVPAFLMTELRQIEENFVVRSSITRDLFFMKPAKPTFHLFVKGSPASLAATLYARYDNDIELVAGRADMRGNFAIPDKKDILRYHIRNMQQEKKAVKWLELVGFVGRAGDTLRNIVGPTEVLNFLGSGVPKINRKKWTVELDGRIEPYEETIERITPTIRMTESESGDYFDVSYDYEIESGSISERDIQQALLKGDSFIERNGRTILLDAEAIKQTLEMFEDCSIGQGDESGSFRVPSIHSSYIESSLQELGDVELSASSDWLTRARQQNRQDNIEKVELSSHLNATLRSYQHEGVNWLRFLENRGFCGILADEMGLGKTIQTLAWIQLERTCEYDKNLPSLIVCPTSLVENWKEEIEKFTPNLKIVILHGSHRHSLWKEVSTSDVVITSYALMRRDIEKHLEFTYAVAILDEAQHIKNRVTQNAVAAKKIKANHRLVLTGTPIENGVSDLWSIMDFLMPGYLGKHTDFRDFYEYPIQNGGEEGEYVQAKLRRKLHPFLLRRLKKDVAKDLPQKIERIAPCNLTQDQHRVYTQLLEESKRRINDIVQKDGFNKSRMEILKTLLRLRQTCCHIDLLKLNNIKSQHPSAKMELFFELLNEALDGKHRVLVFSQFTSMLAILKKEMVVRNLEFCYLDGSTKDRQSVVRKFNQNHEIPVFLMSLKAGGTGLNLTGADMVIHFDPWWNPAVEAQATDRAHRIGQKRTVYSVKLITKGTVEEKVLAMQQRKQTIIDATLTTDEQIMKKLTWDDVQELLNL